MTDYEIISKSKYFDKKWYLKNNVDVAVSKIDPVEHYLTYGWTEGRNPSPRFDNNAYLEMYQDIKNAKINPLVHYEMHGKKEGRKIKNPNIIKLSLYEKICFNILTLKHKLKLINNEEYILQSGKYTNQTYRKNAKSEKIHNKYIPTKYYDAVIPIGNTCHCSMLLRMSGLQNISYPFDWSGSDKNTVNHNDVLSERIKIICDKFQNFLNIEDFVRRNGTPADSEHYLVYNKSNGLHYYHDFPNDKTIAEYFPEFEQKFERRATRLLETIKNSQHVALVWVQNAWDQMNYKNPKLSIYYIHKQMKLLKRKFPNTKFDFYVFYHDETLPEYKIIYTKCGHIHQFVSNHSFVYDDFYSKAYRQHMIKSIYQVLSTLRLNP